MLNSIVLDGHISETSETVGLETLSWQKQFGLDDFLITVTTYFPPQTANIDNFSIGNRHPTDQLSFIMNNNPFPYNPDTIIAFFTLQLYPQLQLFPFFRIEQVHQHS
jgi:hypothetical protein